jgi:dinuclear metal center YbgI/SA1388 family protein
MKLAELCNYLDTAIPLSFQEGYDNTGLQVGFPQNEVTSALLTIDITEEVISEAEEKGCNVVISHHPLIFNGIKKITGQSFTERALMNAIKKVSFGVSKKMAQKLNLKNVNVLVPLKNRLLKLVTFIPESYLEKVRAAIFEAGAGVIGNYDQCGFTVEGKGSFRAGENTNPFTGDKGKIHFENEIRLETILYSHLKANVIKALLGTHPYEEVAFDLYPLDNDKIEEGIGCTGEFDQPIPETDFLRIISSTFEAGGLRYSKLTGRPVKKIALCGGSCASLIVNALSSGADAFVTADIRYHNFFDADNKILLVDTGHFESEKFTTEILYDLIIKKFPKFAVRFSETNTNPINYL